MLINPIINKMQQLHLHTMAKALQAQLEQAIMTELSFEERLGLLIDAELTVRDNRRLQQRLRKAKLQQSACMEDIDYQTHRSLDKALLATLSQGQWVSSHNNILIVGDARQ